MKVLTFAVACALTPIALAADDDPGNSPAVTLITTGLSGSGNQKPGNAPTLTFKNSLENITLGRTRLRDFAAGAGLTVHHSETLKLDWSCMESPAGGADQPAAQIWAFSEDIGKGLGKITAIAMEAAPATPPAACGTLTKPFALELGAPGPGAKLADIAAKFGGLEDREPDGTTAFIYGTDQKVGKEGVLSLQYKYAFDGDTVTAAALQMFYELE